MLEAFQGNLCSFVTSWLEKNGLKALVAMLTVFPEYLSQVVSWRLSGYGLGEG